LADPLLFVDGLAGLADVDRSSIGKRNLGGDEAVRAEEEGGFFSLARVVVIHKGLADAAQGVVASTRYQRLDTKAW
jgi:hypothetical protein